MPPGNALVGQSGGPTSVINASLAGIVDAARIAKGIRRVYGMHFGIEGVLNNDLFDLTRENPRVLKGLRSTPGSALGSSRLKLRDEHFPRILERLKTHKIRYLFMIGGNDTMDTIHRVVEFAGQNGHELVGVGVPKTVDNDLFGTDHTPGYPSAARYMTLSVLQGGILARDMQRVDQFVIFQAIGRSAGWLPAATAAAREATGAPHIILLPERHFDRKKFLAAVDAAHQDHGFVSIVCGEGISTAEGIPVSASQTTDKFGNVEFGAMGGTSVALVLHRMISDAFGWRGEFQVTESLSMCAADRGVRLDFQEAYACGRQAVKLAVRGYSDVMVALQRAAKPRNQYQVEFGTIPLHEVAVQARPMPDVYIADNGMDVTPAFLDYIAPLVGDLPQYTALAGKRVKR